jgi:hypothetical protein
VDNVRFSPIRRFGPSRAIAGLIAFAGAVSAVAAVLNSDPGGRLFLACVTIALLAIAASDLVFSPRLTAGPTGLAIFAPMTRTSLSWAEIDSITVDERTHLGLASRALEIESGDLLVVLSRRRLGMDPREVLTQLEAVRPR